MSYSYCRVRIAETPCVAPTSPNVNTGSGMPAMQRAHCSLHHRAAASCPFAFHDKMVEHLAIGETERLPYENERL
jgi:hypothetical protein